jgi:ComF family protein
MQRDCGLPDCIVPVPLSKKRLRQRGFNQSAELARAVSKNYPIPLNLHAIARGRDTRAQTGLHRQQRLQNIRGAFDQVRAMDAGHVAILDDVVTTGSTVNELARVLKRAGVERVDVWSIARAG